jgi:hypothetical protein
MTWHRPAGRLASKLVPFHRYRCQAPACQWEGHRRVHDLARPVLPGQGRWLAIAGMLFAALATAGYWGSARDKPNASSRHTAATVRAPVYPVDATAAHAGTRDSSARAAVGSP